MTLYNIYIDIKEHSDILTLIIIVLLSLIQIAPIKLNPWSRIISWIQKIFTGNISNKLDAVERKLDKHIAESDERDLRKRRESILDFASAVSNGREYTKEMYEQMLKECDSYLAYCEEKHFPNAVAEESIKLIRKSYATHLKDNSFVQGIYYITPKGGVV